MIFVRRYDYFVGGGNALTVLILAAALAIQKSIGRGFAAAYLAPLRAIVEEKHIEWQQKQAIHSASQKRGAWSWRQLAQLRDKLLPMDWCIFILRLWLSLGGFP